MSRIGKQPIPVLTGVDVTINGDQVKVKGPKGELSRPMPPATTVVQEGDQLVVSRTSEDRRARAMHGLARALLNNMVVGVHTGFQKKLEVRGVGYRATVQGKTLNLELQYSHPINYPFPEGITISVEKNVITVEGPDKEAVGQTAAEIRAFRKPEPYKGKGVRYVDEFVRQKVGKRNV